MKNYLSKGKYIFIIAFILLSTSIYGIKGYSQSKNNSYIFNNSGSVLLKERNLLNLDYRILRLARNEVMARHGYVFKDNELKTYFSSKEWYKQNFKYTGKLTSVEKKNVELIKSFEEVRKKGIIKNNLISQSTFDINGDGKIDEISVKFDGPSVEQGNNYIININGSKITGQGSNLETHFNIIDINIYDDLKEIAVQEDGPSDDYATTFYGYDGKKIFKIGVVQGLCGDYRRLNGKGTVLATTRFEILQTWFYDDEYTLSKNNRLDHVNKLMYKNNWIQNIKVKIPISVVRVSDNKKVILVEGEKLLLIGSDGKVWCFIKRSNGEVCKFNLENFSTLKGLTISADTVFEGLCFAD